MRSLVKMIDWKFTNLALRSLPVDRDTERCQTPRTTPNVCFARARPTPVDGPQIVALSTEALELLFTGQESLTDSSSQPQPPYLTAERLASRELLLTLSGCEVAESCEPAAHCYAGHQFGAFAGQLGDGATMYLGDKLNDLNARWELQLKGAGRTAYSRTADGRKVLRSSIREFLASEAMYYLNVPTTRAGSCITSDSQVVRDIFYDGHPIYEKCTVISRLAPTFLRFGSFQICVEADSSTGRSGPSPGRFELLHQLVDYTVENFYPDIWSNYNPSTQKPEMTRDFLLAVTARTARLVAHWQTVGFCHGVLNTDNMSIVGLTLDYGPFGFMDRFQKDFVCNASDSAARYTYEAQPAICLWNCERLVEALQPIHQPADPPGFLQLVRDTFNKEFQQHYLQLMRAKLGLLMPDVTADTDLVTRLFQAMHDTGADFTRTFTFLTDYSSSLIGQPAEASREACVSGLAADLVKQVCASVEELLDSWPAPRFSQEERGLILRLFNGDLSRLALVPHGQAVLRDLETWRRRESLQALSGPEKQARDVEIWRAVIGRLADRLDRDRALCCEMTFWTTTERDLRMRAANPRLVPRNHLLQHAVQLAEQRDDFSAVRQLLGLFRQPFAVGSGEARLMRLEGEGVGERVDAAPPRGHTALLVS